VATSAPARRACLALLLAMTAAIALLPAEPALAAKECGAYRGKGGPYAVRVLRGPVTCKTARRVLRRYATSKAPCDGSGCYRTQKGWTCGSGGTQAFPRLFSCQRGKKRVGAYSLAD